jgi:branched-subunit amino acid ABC-type transport system permease component
MAISVAAVAVVTLYLFLRHSRHGQFLLAVADNPDLAEAYGISKKRYYALAIVIAGILINTAMYVFGSKIAVHPELTIQMMLFAVSATILGGLGNIFGAAVAAVVLSSIQQASILFVSSRWQPLVIFEILFLTIVIFPKRVRLPARSGI